MPQNILVRPTAVYTHQHIGLSAKRSVRPSKYAKMRFRTGLRLGPAGRDHYAPSDPQSAGEGIPFPIPHPTRRLDSLAFGARHPARRFGGLSGNAGM